MARLTCLILPLLLTACSGQEPDEYLEQVFGDLQEEAWEQLELDGWVRDGELRIEGASSAGTAAHALGGDLDTLQQRLIAQAASAIHFPDGGSLEASLSSRSRRYFTQAILEDLLENGRGGDSPFLKFFWVRAASKRENEAVVRLIYTGEVGGAGPGLPAVVELTLVRLPEEGWRILGSELP